MMNNIYVKPQMEVVSFLINTSVATSPQQTPGWTVDGNKQGDQLNQGDEDLEVDSRKNDSGWYFEW